MSPISKRILIPFVLLPVLAGSVLRFWRTEHQAMSPEEAITWQIAVQPSITETVHLANHWKDGWIFYMILHVWASLFGDALESLRVFSAACGTTTIFCVGLLTGTFVNAMQSPHAPNEVWNLNATGSAVLGICLIGGLGSHLQMSRAVSPAVLGCLFVVLAILFLVHALGCRRSPTKRKVRYLYWAGYGTTTACVLFTKPFFLIFYIAHIPYILFCFCTRCDDDTLVPKPRSRLWGKRLATILILLYCGPFLFLATKAMAQTRSIESTHVKQLGEQWSQAVLARDVLRWGPDWQIAGLCVITAGVFIWMMTQRREYALLIAGQAAVGIAACFCLMKADDLQAIQELQYAVLVTSVTIVFSLIPSLITRQFGLTESLVLCIFLLANNLVPFLNWIDRISDNETLSGMRGVISHIRRSENATVPILTKQLHLYCGARYYLRKVSGASGRVKLFLEESHRYSYVSTCIANKDDIWTINELNSSGTDEVFVVDSGPLFELLVDAQISRRWSDTEGGASIAFGEALLRHGKIVVTRITELKGQAD